VRTLSEAKLGEAILVHHRGELLVSLPANANIPLVSTYFNFGHLGSLIVELFAVFYIDGIIELEVRLTLENVRHALDLNEAPALRQFFIQSLQLF